MKKPHIYSAGSLAVSTKLVSLKDQEKILTIFFFTYSSGVLCFNIVVIPGPGNAGSDT
jgi:hypothetical protein